MKRVLKGILSIFLLGYASMSLADTAYYIMNYKLINADTKVYESHTRLGVETTVEDTYRFCEIPLTKSRLLPSLDQQICSVSEGATGDALITDATGHAKGTAVLKVLADGAVWKFSGEIYGSYSFEGHEIYTDSDQTQGTYTKAIKAPNGKKFDIYGSFNIISKETFDEFKAKFD